MFYVPEPFRLVIDVAERDASLRATRNVRRVVLDPGHGGYDPGAIGPTGLREKDVALDIAHRAAPLVARELGISTLLTRDADVFVPLEERTARANAFGADLFISIHCNATEHSGSSGVMTFVLDGSHDHQRCRCARFRGMNELCFGNVKVFLENRQRDSSPHFLHVLVAPPETQRFGQDRNGRRSTGSIFRCLLSAVDARIYFTFRRRLPLDLGDYRKVVVAECIIETWRPLSRCCNQLPVGQRSERLRPGPCALCKLAEGSRRWLPA